MGRKQRLKDGDEFDVIFNRDLYCYLVNRPINVKRVKRRLNKRFRRELKKELLKELKDLL
jgi:hypothetical protein